MERLAQIQQLLLRSRRMPWVLLGLTLAILAGAILLTTQQTRARIHEQIAGRHGEVLCAVARMQQAGTADDLIGSIEEPANQFMVILELSRLSGVMGARLFDRDGNFVETFPAEVQPATLSPDDLPALQRLQPVSHFRPAVPVDELFLPEVAEPRSEPSTMAILEVNVPLHAVSDRRLAGVAQFVVEGHSIAAEYRRLDGNLLRQAVLVFLAGALVLIVAMGWSFRRLHRAHHLLAERTETLLQANQELALAAKTSAVGAVTSHLIHGLKNPLAGLQTFVAGLGATLADHPDGDLQQAIATTRRMQSMINEVVSVLREEEGAGQYEIALAELADIISTKVQPLCRERGVECVTKLEAGAVLPNRAANLVALILVNLVQNAVEVSPPGNSVQLTVTSADESIACEVSDRGPGFPAGRNPFTPCQSTKEGGSGIGLAISKQLANHLGARLEIKNSSPAGCVFVLLLPSALWMPKTSSVTLTLG